MASDNFNEELIAPCGMNCGICDKYLAYSHQLPKKRGKICYCIGCRPQNKNCSFIKKKCHTGEIYKIEFCFECYTFPCTLLLEGSKKYKERYGYGFVESLNLIKKKGVEWFVEHQAKIHNCEKCGDTICIHNKKCYSCDRQNILAK